MRARPKKWASVGAVAGAVTVVVAWGFKTFAGIELTLEVAGAMQVIVTYIVQQVAPD